MALNGNHIFEDLGEQKCSIVEKNCSQLRVNFLKEILEQNNFKVVVVNSQPPKAQTKSIVEGETEINVSTIPIPETFTIGVTDLSFNPVNAIYNRELKTSNGVIITRKYWNQAEIISRPELWYWKK